MSLILNNPWLALVLGVLIGWLLEWLLETWFFRRRRLECQRRLDALQATLHAREDELRDMRITAKLLQSKLWIAEARKPAAAETKPVAEAVTPAPAAGQPRVELEAVEPAGATEDLAFGKPVVGADSELDPPRVDSTTPDEAEDVSEAETASAQVAAELPPIIVAGRSATPDLAAGGMETAEGETSEFGIEAGAAEVDLAEVETAEFADIETAPGVGENDVDSDLPDVAAETPAVALDAPEVGIEAGTVAASQPEIETAEVADGGEAAIAGADVDLELPAGPAAPPIAVSGLEPAAPDDLTKVTGIGPTYARILREHGIHTFADLAGQGEEALAAMIDAPIWRRADYAGWISQAGERAGLAGNPASPGSAPAEPAVAPGARAKAERAARGPQTRGSVSVSCPQDLSRVLGIGQIFEKRLYTAGIGTFWDLGQMAEEDLRQILELGGYEDIDLQAIREDAKRLAGTTGTDDTSWDGTPHDDLGSLRGVGQAEQERLYAAGICTYGALAGASIEDLARICPAAAGEAHNYPSWISQAQDRLRTA